MWIWDLLEKNIKSSVDLNKNEIYFELSVPSEVEILKYVGDGKGKPTEKSDDMLLRELEQFGRSGKFIELFDLGLPTEPDEQIHFLEKVSQAIYDGGEQGRLLGYWESKIAHRTLSIIWSLPAWHTNPSDLIIESQPLTDVLLDWYINYTD